MVPSKAAPLDDAPDYVLLYSDLERGVNSDGIDIVSTSDVLIADSIIATADDAICLKTVDLGGRGAGTIRPTENVVVNNCILTSSSAAMMIGTETHADIRHVLFSNIIVRNSNKVFGINVQDGATVSDVRFVNVTFETNRRHWNWWGSAELMKVVLKKRTAQSRLGFVTSRRRRPGLPQHALVPAASKHKPSPPRVGCWLKTSRTSSRCLVFAVSTD